MLLEPRKPGELVADFDYSMSTDEELVCPFAHFEGGTLLIGLEKEAVFAVVYYGHILVLGRLTGGELDMSENPGLRSLFCQWPI